MACPANHPKLNKTVRVAVTGTAGNIGYALLFRLASGAVFGPNTPVQLQLLERDNEQSKAALQASAWSSSTAPSRCSRRL